ncbi:Keratinocyte-associated protein 2 [Dillenia turbinata]|uniref:Keratinocyte-associated protein 2 n=1 Tax=Dillenia turbinata TaxID=194707 RepID=A0AAN8ZMQ6_9MAGN
MAMLASFYVPFRILRRSKSVSFRFIVLDLGGLMREKNNPESVLGIFYQKLKYRMTCGGKLDPFARLNIDFVISLLDRVLEKKRTIDNFEFVRKYVDVSHGYGVMLKSMAGSNSSMLSSFLLFSVILSLQEMYRTKLATSELLTILGGFSSSLIFLVLLTFIGNFQETCGIKTGWGAGEFSLLLSFSFFEFKVKLPVLFMLVVVILAEAVALIAAGTVHRVCITTCFLFSVGLLYEINKLSGMTLARSESKTKRH